MKKISGTLLAFVALFGFDACLTKDNGSSNNISLEYDVTVLSLNQTTRQINTREVSPYCEAGVAAYDTSLDTTRYAISGGHLYIWEKSNDCSADVLDGSSSTVIGSWTTTTFAQAAIPTADRPSGCPASVSASDSDGIDQFLRNGSGSYDVSTSKIHIKVAGEVCFADAFAEGIAGESGPITITSGDCSTVSLKNATNSKTATLSSSVSNNAITLTFKSGSTTCTASEVLNLPGTTPDCSKPGIEDNTFTNCLVNSGFYSTTTAKKAVGSFHKALVRHHF